MSDTYEQVSHTVNKAKRRYIAFTVLTLGSWTTVGALHYIVHLSFAEPFRDLIVFSIIALTVTGLITLSFAVHHWEVKTELQSRLEGFGISTHTKQKN